MSASPLRGKGIWAWRRAGDELGRAIGIAQQTSATHILYKVGQGETYYDDSASAARRITGAGLVPFAWTWLTLDDPEREAQVVLQAFRDGYQGFVFDMEAPCSRKFEAARKLVRALQRADVNPEALFLCSFPNISAHTDLPYTEMLEICRGGLMPMAYGSFFAPGNPTPWEVQARRVIDEWTYGHYEDWCLKWGFRPPLYPVLGPYHDEYGSAPMSPEEFRVWLDRVAANGPTFVSFYTARAIPDALVPLIRDFAPAEGPVEMPIPASVWIAPLEGAVLYAAPDFAASRVRALIYRATAEGAGGVPALMLLAVLLSLAASRPRLTAGLYPFLYAAPLGLIATVYREIPKWGARHASLFAPASFLALAVSWGSVGNIRPRGLRALSAIALTLATLVVGTFLWQADRNLLTNPAYAREDWRAAARYVQENRAPGDIVIISTGSIFPTWLYYAGDEGMLPMPNDPLLDVTHVLTYTEVARQLNAALSSCSPAPCDPSSATCSLRPAPCSVWLVAWLDGVTDPTRLVETMLEDVAREEPVPYFRKLRVRRFLLDRPPDFPLEPPTTDRPDAELLPGIRLWGYTLPEGPHPADQPLSLRAWWVTDDPNRHAGLLYMASFRLRDALGTEWGQDDRIVTDGDYRPERWTPGIPVWGRFFLHLPAGIPPGVYTPTLTLFTKEAAGSIALRPVTITRPASPPEMPGEFTPARAAGGSAPLILMGVHLFRAEGSPCRSINGELFWEVRESLREECRVAVSVGEHREENSLAPASSQALLRPGDRIRSYFQLTFPCRALDLQADLEVRLLRADGTETGGVWYGPPVTVRTERVFAEPTVPYEPVGADFGPGFATLLGYRVDPSPVRAGEPFTVTLIWRAGFTDDVPRSVFVHIAPPDAPAPLAAQHDGWPAGGARPTHTWVWGEIITDPHPLPGLPAGRYQIRVGLYGPDGERMPVALGPESPPDRALSFPLEVLK